MIIWITAALPWLRDRAEEFGDFLRSIPSLLAPKPSPLSPPYTPPFTGGQCLVQYRITWNSFFEDNTPFQSNQQIVLNGAFVGVQFFQSSSTYPNSGWYFVSQSGTARNFITNNPSVKIVVQSVVRVDGLADACGNTPNPTPPPAIPDDGLFNPTNPHIADDNGTLNPAAIVLAPAAPLVLVPLIGSAIAAALAAARAASSALEAIQKVAEALEGLGNLWDKLKEFLEDWEKNRPKKRDIVRQTYGRILGDGAIDFFPDNNNKFQAIQLDVVITNIPIGFGRYFGSLSPSRYRFKELGYIAFYSVNQGILETHSIQFKRTSYQIPELAVGFIYHLGLDEQIKGFAFGTFSVEKI